MSLSAAEQGQTEQSTLLPKQLDAHKPMISKKKAALLLGVAAVVGLSTFFFSTGIRKPASSSGLVEGKNGAVAVEAEQCSNVGIDILKKGGNAVDSAIASALCIGVIDSFATGIGGGGFMLIRSPNGTYDFIDFRETAPGAAHKDMFVKDPSKAQVGGLSVGVPGEIRGFQLAHERHGKLPWGELFAPAIDMSRNGFNTTRLLAQRLQSAKEWIMQDATFSAVFAPNGQLALEGQLIKRPSLADTLEIIAKEGPDAFYEGLIAASIVNTTVSNGGILTMDDMKNYQAIARPPISTYYHGRKIVTGGTPTSGHVLISALNILERFNLRLQGEIGLNVHRLVEALKYGFAFRTELGDPDYVDNADRLEEIISKDWASLARANISDDHTHEPTFYNPKFDNSEAHGTMHLSVVDENDGAVALTSTVNLLFGARIMDPVTGIILNDEMDDFSIPGIPNAFGLQPSVYNYVYPGKRSLSSCVPTIIERDSKFEMAVGASGGSMIITATLGVILDVVDYGKNIFDAIVAPRLHHQLMPNTAIVEDGFSKQYIDALQSRGHDVFVLPKSMKITAVQAVMRSPDGTVYGASDIRKYGQAAVY
ncbi:gamma-glutamyltranspeptidase [Umbelopsis sp. AD052]|nr:gamma-glutamyltranspeptidase [Umbelopsis sp. AD052]